MKYVKQGMKSMRAQGFFTNPSLGESGRVFRHQHDRAHAGPPEEDVEGVLELAQDLRGVPEGSRTTIRLQN